tara:strand:+ start:51615 stop:52553 length:939 start_codon:yes stop_codon:yes gene_type:complete
MRTTASYLRVLGFVTLTGILIHFLSETEDSVFLSSYWPWIFIGIVCLLSIALEVCIEALQAVLFKTLHADARQRYLDAEALAKEQLFSKFKRIYKKLLGSRPIEEESEIILDHNYDGIRELDNNLPPWWVYGFYATMIFAAVYLIRFEIMDGPDQEEEYLQELAQAKQDIEAYKKTAKDLIDINTVTQLTEASDLKAGSAIFQANCIACHKSDGGGGIGPNLTDNYWILGGGIKNVFHTISEGGRDGKGMISWKQSLKPGEIQQVASYVLSLQGTTPAEPKDAQGEIWEDPDDNQSNKPGFQPVDSTAIGSK